MTNSFPRPDDDFSHPDDEADSSPRRELEHVASWASAVVSRVSTLEADRLPGIVSPLELRAEFAVNSQSDAASVTLGNALVRLVRESSVPTSGTLTLSLRWSPGYRADGVSAGDVLIDDWFVELVETTRIDLSHAALVDGRREATVPVVTIVKPSAAEVGDEFTARVSGEAPECRDASIRGWVHD
ncbi:hypothetical protein N1027_01365 [Herbiconiux sp. CPCC 205763]|uniref:Uncharacterized protein n=1 Tax=Herbiconiux aconitum TaxID=2970913 RepID=A0ABT2GPC5_9MICO|nr:hypothetical protein [Herbiconiux aconitum]MCS5716779.1 hypothetical protein [Herbiconiux aconitum]